jgi:hypothetical protein
MLNLCQKLFDKDKVHKEKDRANKERINKALVEAGIELPED